VGLRRRPKSTSYSKYLTSMAPSNSLRIELLLASAADPSPSIASIVSVGPSVLYRRGPRALSGGSGIVDVYLITDACG
jgi:hypothetical protein